MAELGTTDNKSNYISDLVDRHAKNNQLKYLFSDPFKLSDYIF